MDSINTIQKKVSLLLLSFVLIHGLCSDLIAKVEGDLDLLKKTATMIKENKESIRYWQGSAKIERLWEENGNITRREEYSAEFWFSKKQEASRWSMSNDKLDILDDAGKLIAGEKRERHNEMKRGNRFYRYKNYYTIDNGERKKSLTIWPLSEADQSTYTTTFDPMWYLTNKKRDLAVRLMFYYHEANNPELSDVKVWQEGDLVILEATSGDLIDRHTFDISKSGALIQYIGIGGKNIEDRNWSYEQHNGVWVPKTFFYTMETIMKYGGTKINSYKVRFANNQINETIPDSEFELESLGVKNGDDVSDTILKTGYYYEGKDRFDLANPSFNEVTKATTPPKTDEPLAKPQKGASLQVYETQETEPSQEAVEKDKENNEPNDSYLLYIITAIVLVFIIVLFFYKRKLKI
ncbi:MAG: hypothetical protein JEZ07_00795 [Phycisphaerae bacterium]|nr:hypothetical protein [Phycisphaerae bacterium]